MQTSENLMKNLRNQSVVSKETLIHARKGGKYRLRMQNLFNWWDDMARERFNLFTFASNTL